MKAMIPLSILLIAAAASAQTTETPILEPGVLIHDGDAPLSIGHTASVEVVDWNNDGKKDLLVGTFSGGNILLFLNKGKDVAPEFDGGTRLMAGGKVFTAGSG